MRVFLGPVEVAGFYASLRRGFEAIGVQVLIADLVNDARRYDAGSRSPVVRLAEFASAAVGRIDARHRRTRDWVSRLASLARVILLAWAALRCQVFVLGYGGSITYYPELEFRLLRRLGKRIIFVFHGSDSRPPYLECRLTMHGRQRTADDFIRATEEVHATVMRAHRYGDVVVDNPFAAHLHPARCVNAQAIGNPYPTPTATEPPPRDDGLVRVLHSPSAPELKGSDRIRSVIERLQGRGLPIEYVELTGRPHAEVVEELRRCDFVVDQAYSDTPMALFATEAGAYGRPAVVGGYALPYFGEYLQEEWRPPTVYCHPDDLEATIERLVRDADERRRLGMAAREFVARARAPEAVAARFLRLAEGDVPDAWWFDPGAVEYVHGLGDEAVVRRLVRDVVARGGVAALRLAHNPSVEARVLAFAGLSVPRADRADVAGAATP